MSVMYSIFLCTNINLFTLLQKISLHYHRKYFLSRVWIQVQIMQSCVLWVKKFFVKIRNLKFLYFLQSDTWMNFKCLAEKIFIEEWTETVYIKSIAWRLYDDSCSGFTKLQADDVLQNIMQFTIDSLLFQEHDFIFQYA